MDEKAEIVGKLEKMEVFYIRGSVKDAPALGSTGGYNTDQVFQQAFGARNYRVDFFRRKVIIMDPARRRHAASQFGRQTDGKKLAYDMILVFGQYCRLYADFAAFRPRDACAANVMGTTTAYHNQPIRANLFRFGSYRVSEDASAYGYHPLPSQRLKRL